MTDVVEHEWPDPPTEHNECIHCGTWQAYHETKAQPCVPRWRHGEPAPWRSTRTGQSVRDFAADDVDFIRNRLAELEAERLNAEEETRHG